MDPEVQEILIRFDGLASPDRRAVYRQILSQFNLDEWRDVRDQLDRVSFHKDILSAVPLEIAAQITKYLDLSELHVFQRVSKDWHSLLTSSLIRAAVFRRYTGYNYDSVTAGSSDEFSAFARRRVRLERGQPLWKICDPAYLPLPKPWNATSLDYCNGRYAWIDGTTIVVHSLHSNMTQYFCTQNRDPLMEVRLSENVIAATTPRGFFMASGRSIALAFIGIMTSEGDYVLYWDLNTRAARTINIATHLGYMALNSEARSLTTVHLEERNYYNACVQPQHSPAKRAHLQVTKYLVDESATFGRSSSYTLELPAIVDATGHVEIRYPDTSPKFSDRMGLFSVRPREGSPSALSSMVTVAYDPRTDQVDLHVLQPEHTPFYPLCMTSVDHNILYYIKNDNGKPQIWISNPDATSPHRPSKCMNPQLPREATSRVYSHATGFALHGDREFILMIDENGLKVWCFDEAIHIDDYSCVETF
ncbi:hypothetical protein EYZ11_004756 [Aspergillus tanneri]|uniref:F-box domain-containing protein n=1 Tax=Aspergillus tanneri TaxID=1220188 RepID=A0A4S3JJM6_9EURO|nr:hypothetical protein EYZ11_004756 [Aspergillus tanneri]